jgi:hypothetical protein
MDWLICVVLGHNWKYKCQLELGKLANTRICQTCGKKQHGRYIHDDYNTTWSNDEEK